MLYEVITDTFEMTGSVILAEVEKLPFLLTADELPDDLGVRREQLFMSLTQQPHDGGSYNFV